MSKAELEEWNRQIKLRREIWERSRLFILKELEKIVRDVSPAIGEISIDEANNALIAEFLRKMRS